MLWMLLLLSSLLFHYTMPIYPTYCLYAYDDDDACSFAFFFASPPGFVRESKQTIKESGSEGGGGGIIPAWFTF